MATLNSHEKRQAMASRHADFVHACKFCGKEFRGNGGFASHMRKEYFERMPDLLKEKRLWPTKDLRAEWRKRQAVQS